MNLTCFYCQTPFTLSMDQKVAALRKMHAENLHHYDAHCPRCGRANAISRERLEMFTPGWEEAIKEPAMGTPVPAGQGSTAPAAMPIMAPAPAAAMEPMKAPAMKKQPARRRHPAAKKAARKTAAKKAPAKKAPAKKKTAARKKTATKAKSKASSRKTAKKSRGR